MYILLHTSVHVVLSSDHSAASDGSTTLALHSGARTINRPPVIDSTHAGQYCVVMYDDKPYPGVIMSVDEDDVEVKCMHTLGKNMFFWPSIRDDISICTPNVMSSALLMNQCTEDLGN